MTLRYSIALTAAVLGGCASAENAIGVADGGDHSTRRVAIHWPIEAGVSSFVTQSAARSEQPFPCGSGVNSQHILESAHGENHDYEHSLDIVTRDLGVNPFVPHDGRGTDVVAVAAGTVVAVSSNQSECDRDLGAGNFVVIEHPGLQVNGAPILSAYMHLNSTAVAERSLDCDLNPVPIPAGGFESPRVGSQIVAGQKIGELGNTGNSTGTHLHFQFATECTLMPADSVECAALSVLEVHPEGFSDLTVARHESCPTLAVGGPVVSPPSTEKYLSDGSYVTSDYTPAAPIARPHQIASR